ncbi:hypothetical protein TM239_28440 [Bradyrhizobium sp. TM239]|nr:hypothetical protein TM239_28440 [Bradyrhizobium sp. TM239]
MLRPAKLAKPSSIGRRGQRAVQQKASPANVPLEKIASRAGRQAFNQLDCATIPGSNLSAISGLRRHP